MKRSFIDHHCHLLPAFDDGATDLQESLEMARLLASFGFSELYCTPHRIKGCFENDPERVEKATASLQHLLERAGIELRLIAGTEHYLDEFLLDQLPNVLTISQRYLLLEVPFRAGSAMLPAAVEGLAKRGLTPLFAHPERCAAFEPPQREEGGRGPFSFALKRQKRPDMEGSLILGLKDAGCRFQGNLGSFAGFYGSEVKQRALLFLKHGVYACLGSDAHRSERLSSLLSTGLEVIVEAVGEDAAYELLAGTELRSEGN